MLLNRKISGEKTDMLFTFPYALFGAVLSAVAINTFVYSANLVPAGMTGLSLLLQAIILRTFHINISFTVINILLNLPAAILAYKWVGRKFTLVSFTLMFITSALIDIIPKYQITTDPLLAAVFGGLICGIASSFELNQGASGGGTDFIAMSLSAKYHISAFNYMLYFNMVLIAIQGANFGINIALYSIIYQYCNTQVVNYMYKRFKKQTLLIITKLDNAVSDVIIKFTKHSATKINATGCFSGSSLYLIYTLITQPEVKGIMTKIKEADPNAFVNILETVDVSGDFYYAPVGKYSEEK